MKSTLLALVMDFAITTTFATVESPRLIRTEPQILEHFKYKSLKSTASEKGAEAQLMPLQGRP